MDPSLVVHGLGSLPFGFCEVSVESRTAAIEVPRFGSFCKWGTSAVNLFLHKADYFLVAEGHASKMTVVTYEKSAPTSRSSIKIPDACDAMRVGCIAPQDVACGRRTVRSSLLILTDDLFEGVLGRLGDTRRNRPQLPLDVLSGSIDGDNPNLR